MPGKAVHTPLGDLVASVMLVWERKREEWVVLRWGRCCRWLQEAAAYTQLQKPPARVYTQVQQLPRREGAQQAGVYRQMVRPGVYGEPLPRFALYRQLLIPGAPPFGLAERPLCTVFLPRCNPLQHI